MSNKNIVLLKHPSNWGLNEPFVEKLAKKALSDRGYKNNIELSLVFVGKNKAKKLNIEFRNKNYIPQVLGFPLSKEEDIDGMIRLGDIVICTQKLKYEVKFQKSNLEKILYQWLDHGIENLEK